MAEQEDSISQRLQNLDDRGFVLFASPDGALDWRPKVGNKTGSLTDADFKWLKANKDAVRQRLIKQQTMEPSTLGAQGENQGAIVQPQAPAAPSMDPTVDPVSAAVPATLTTGGAAAAEALAAKAGAGPLMRNLAKLGGASAAGMATEFIPKALGGAEAPSLGRGAVFGGMQELGPAPFGAAARDSIEAGEKNVARNALRREGEVSRETGAAERALKAAQKEQTVSKAALDKSNEQIRQMLSSGVGVKRGASELGYQPQAPNAPGIGLAGVPAQQAYYNAAKAARGQAGQQLGMAYEGLKLSPTEAPNMAGSVDMLEQAMTSPISPAARKLGEEMKSFQPQNVSRGMTPEGEGVQYEAKTLDSLRDLRQRVSKQLGSAKGGDRFYLRRLEEMADDALEPHLPVNVQQLRQAYRGVMRVVPYEADNAVEKAINPAEVADHFYETPERAHALLDHIQSPADQKAAQDAFAQKIMSKVKPSDPANKQIEQMKNAVQPYIDSGVVEKLHSRQTADTLRNVMDAPKNVYAFQTMLADPKFRTDFQNEFNTFMTTPEGQEMSRKVNEGYQRYTEALNATKEGQQRLAQAPEFRDKSVSDAAARKMGIQEHLEGKDQRGFPWKQAAHWALWAGFGGGAGYYSGVDPQIIAMGSLAGLGITGAWNQAMKAGAAAPLANVLASTTARTTARNFARYLAALGAQGIREKQITKQEQPQPVEMPQ